MPLPANLSCYPRQVTLEVGYWARRATEHKIVYARIAREDFALLPNRALDESMPRPTYELRIIYAPVKWIDLLNYFMLGASTINLFYVASFLSVVACIMVIWGLVRLACIGAKRRRPTPALRFFQFQRLYLTPSVKAFTLVSIPVMVLVVFLQYIFVRYSPMASMPGDLGFLGPGSSKTTRDKLVQWQRGRIGFILLLAGIFTLRDTIRLWVPEGSAPQHTVQAQRYSLLRSTFWYLCCMVASFEFTFSTIFKMSPGVFWLIFKTVCIVAEFNIAKQGNSLFFPKVVLLEVCSLLWTGWLTASSFIAFVLVQMIELGINTFRRILIEPPKGYYLAKFHKREMVQRATTQSRAQKDGGEGGGGGASDALPELPMPKAAAKRAFEPQPRLASQTDSAGGADSGADDAADVHLGLRHTLVIWCTDTTALYIELLMISIVYILRHEFEVAKLFGIKESDMIYFLLFVSSSSPRRGSRTPSPTTLMRRYGGGTRSHTCSARRSDTSSARTAGRSARPRPTSGSSRGKGWTACL